MNKIISVFRASDRIEEYVNHGFKLPRLDNGNIDFWQLSKDLCNLDGGHLITELELDELVKKIYDTTGHLIKSAIPKKLKGLGTNFYYLWSSSETSAGSAYGRDFYNSVTFRGNSRRNSSSIRAVCVGE